MFTDWLTSKTRNMKSLGGFYDGLAFSPSFPNNNNNNNVSLFKVT